MGAMGITPASAVEAFTCLSPLELLVQSEARSAAHRLRSLVCWTYRHPNRDIVAYRYGFSSQTPYLIWG